MYANYIYLVRTLNNRNFLFKRRREDTITTEQISTHVYHVYECMHSLWTHDFIKLAADWLFTQGRRGLCLGQMIWMLYLHCVVLLYFGVSIPIRLVRLFFFVLQKGVGEIYNLFFETGLLLSHIGFFVALCRRYKMSPCLLAISF